MKRFRNINARLRSVLLVMILAVSQVVGAAGPILNINKAVAATPTICTNDLQGANDEPGQKDLSRFCKANDDVTGELTVAWQWDEISWSGSNTGDACALFDTNSNNSSNYAVCVTVSGSPATQTSISPRIYTCNDTALEKCAGSSLVPTPGSYLTTCTVAQSITDPFSGPSNKQKGAAYPKDTRALCVIKLSEVGAGAAVLKDVCSFPSQQPNSDPSDCVVTPTGQANPVIELKKDIAPNSDAGRFNLKIDLAVDVVATNVGDGGTTGETEFTGNSVVIEETAFTGTLLANYTTQVVCVDDEDPLAAPFFNQSRNAGEFTRTATVSIPNGVVDITCTFVNTRQSGTITLIKNVVNNNGGNAGVNAFGLSVGGTAVTSGQTLTLSPGSYAINEAGLSGYAFVSVTGAGCPATLGGTVTLANNQNITCTITNDDQAGRIRVVKNVVNNNGGNALSSDFELRINGIARVQNQYYASNAATYTVSESSVPGYTQTGITCLDDNTQRPVSHPVNLALGQSVTCTVTNDDNAPQLKVLKNVTNDNGGTAVSADFQLTVNTANVNQNTAIAGTNANTAYTVSEVTKAGYAGTAVTCVDDNTSLVISSSQTASGSITLNEGQSATCTVYNNDIAPKLTVIKSVTNDDGGRLQVSDFPLYVGNVRVVSGVQNDFSAGVYVVSETNQPGYVASNWGVNCDLGGNITLVVGGVYTCTITNNDQPARIIVDKVVNNNNGGTANDDDWNLLVNQTVVADEATNTFNGNVQYTISEQNGPAGYVQVSLSCQDITVEQAPVNISHPFTALLGHTYRCTITNNDQPANLTLVKTVTNDDGGTATQDLWTLTATGPEVLTGQDATLDSSTGVNGQVNAGTYTLSETGGPSGYTASQWNCVGTGAQQQGNSVTLSLNANVRCTINNNDQPANLVLVKNLPNDNGGTATQTDFPVFITGQAASWGSNSVSAGSYVVSETTLAGYLPSAWSSDCDANGNVTLLPGQTKTCTITNDDQAPSLTLNKIVSNTHGGTATESNWTVTATGPTTLSGPGTPTGADVVSSPGFSAGTYSLSESTGPAGYSASLWTCTNNVAVRDGQITLANGQTTVCSITNSDVAPSLTVTKLVFNPYGNPLLASAFPLFVDGDSVTSGVATTDFNAGTHTVTETQQPGYTLTGVGGDCIQDNEGIISVLLSLASASTCTLTNTAIQPKIVVIKHVINDNGGTKTAEDFTMTVSGNSVVVPNFAGTGSPGTSVNLNEGSYSVDELVDAGYAKTLGSDCAGTITIGQVKTCTITNNDIAPVLTLRKIVISSNAESQASDWTLTATPSTGTALAGNGENGFVSKAATAHTTYTLSEAGPDGFYDASEWDCTSSAGVFSNPDGINNEIRMSVGANVTCTITNTERAKVVVTKYNDLNRNGQFDPNEASIPEPALSGWTITLDGVSQVTGSNGTTTFADVQPNEPAVVDEVQQTGWNLSNVSCDSDDEEVILLDESLLLALNDVNQLPNGHVINPRPGQTVNCLIGNYRDVVLNLTKSNNRPNPTTVGDTVTYTLVASVPVNSGVSFSTTVTDLPPENFNYVSGSWTANSSFRGDLKLAGVTTEPNYGSPGEWKLGNMLPGEVVTMTYRAKIAANVSDGTYPDVAFAQGCAAPLSGGECLDEEVVLGNLSRATDPFVATNVTIASPQVLAASITRTVLVDTGTKQILVYSAVASALMIVGVYVARSRNITKGGAK